MCGLGLHQALATWRRQGTWRHVAAVATLMAVAAVRWWPATFSPVPLPDEANYFRAIEWLLQGESPYREAPYLYPPAVAVAGAWAVEHLGQGVVLTLIRLVNLLGLGAAFWGAFAWLPWSWRWRLLLGGTLLCLAPPVRLGYLWGNLSLLTSGLIVVGLLIWNRWPVTAGTLLGASIAIKPVAPVAVLVLLAHRPGQDGHRHVVAGMAAGAIAAFLIVAPPYLGDMLALTRNDLIFSSVSLHRLPHLLGWRGNPFWVWGAIALGSVVIARRRIMGPAHLVAFASAATVAATPLVWPHTLIVTLPLQVLAVQVACHRLAATPPGDDKRRRRWELLLVVLAVAAIQFSQGATNIYDQPWGIQLMALLPAVAPLALAGYLLRTTDPF